jgi:hypothetical protein
LNQNQRLSILRKCITEHGSSSPARRGPGNWGRIRSVDTERLDVVVLNNKPGMGQQIAIKLAEQGCSKIFCADLNEKGLQKTKELVEQKSSAARVTLYVADVSQDAAVREMVEACVKTFGRLDFAANNAGIGLGGTRTHETDVALLEKLYKVNEKGVRQTPVEEYNGTDQNLNRCFSARNMK